MKIKSTCIPDNILKLMDKKERPKGVAGMTRQEIVDKEHLKTERNIHEDIISYLRRSSIPYDHSRMDRKSTNTRGHPDFSIYLRNRVLFLEVKMPSGKLSDVQEERILELSKAGNQVEVIYSYDQAKIKINEFFNVWKN